MSAKALKINKRPKDDNSDDEKDVNEDLEIDQVKQLIFDMLDKSVKLQSKIKENSIASQKLDLQIKILKQTEEKLQTEIPQIQEQNQEIENKLQKLRTEYKDQDGT